ncbi:MAG: J domain-containing protein, partial [Limisphaerales bacterium]
MDNSNHFETIGLKPGASPEEIKRAYLALVKRWHPDRFAHDPVEQKQAEERLKSINVAYEALVGEAKIEPGFQRGTTAPAYDPSDVATHSGRASYSFRERPQPFAFWRGHTGSLSWAGTAALAVISLASLWFVADTLADHYAPPYEADSIRHEAKQQSVIARTRRAAEQGEAWAIFNMGWFHLTG